MFFSPTYSFSLARGLSRNSVVVGERGGLPQTLCARVRTVQRLATIEDCACSFFFSPMQAGARLGAIGDPREGLPLVPPLLSLVFFVVVVLHIFRANLFKRAHLFFFFLQNLTCCTLCVLPTCPLSRDGEMCRDCRSKQPFFAPPPPSCELAVWNTVPNAKLVCGEWGGFTFFTSVVARVRTAKKGNGWGSLRSR